mmetsp:Transcript_18772/g.63409  ORF Transcript_18772/g.63409 Transcript_18772/m.63409 type:complete len:233 (-) Transcript_18772:752-1450(-)
MRRFVVDVVLPAKRAVVWVDHPRRPVGLDHFAAEVRGRGRRFAVQREVQHRGVLVERAVPGRGAAAALVVGVDRLGAVVVAAAVRLGGHLEQSVRVRLAEVRLGWPRVDGTAAAHLGDELGDFGDDLLDCAPRSAARLFSLDVRPAHSRAEDALAHGPLDAKRGQEHVMVAVRKGHELGARDAARRVDVEALHDAFELRVDGFCPVEDVHASAAHGVYTVSPRHGEAHLVPR